MNPLIDGSIQAGFEATSELLKLLDNHLPGQQQLYEKFKEKHPIRAMRMQKKIMAERLRQLRVLHRFAVEHGINPVDLVAYIQGDTTTAKVLQQMAKQ